MLSPRLRQKILELPRRHRIVEHGAVYYPLLLTGEEVRELELLVSKLDRMVLEEFYKTLPPALKDSES